MELIEHDERLQDFNAMNVWYDTPLRGNSSNIDQIATRLLAQIQDEGVFDRYKGIYFIAHSMGGLVAKSLLVELGHPSQVDKFSKVRAVLYIATPAQGVEEAAWIYLTSGNPQLRDMAPAHYNSYLQRLEIQWSQLICDRGSNGFPKSYCAHETKPTGWGLFSMIIVNRMSAKTDCDNLRMLAVDEDHINIVKPLDAQSVIYRWAQARLVEASRSAEPNLQTNMSIQLAPRVLRYVHHYKSDGVTIRHKEYGFGVVVRARNNGGKIERLRALEITGDIAADSGDISDGKTIEELGARPTLQCEHERPDV